MIRIKIKLYINMKKYYIIIAFLIAGLYSFAETTLYTPVLVAPIENAINQMPNVLLNWDPVSGNIGLRYEVQVDTASSFSNPIVLQTELSGARPSGLLFATKYFWRVRGIDNTGTSEWSVTRSFTVIVTVVLGSPAVNATGIMPNAEIAWSAITGLTYYDLQVDTVSTFDSPLTSIIAVPGTQTKTNLSNLYFNTKYYRRMRARHQNDTSAWSAIRSFTTRKTIKITTPPSPDSLGVDQNVLVTFKWDAIKGINKYIILVADNPDFLLPSSIETTKNTINSDTLNFGVTYYWKVEAIHALDMVSSPIRSFTTISKVNLVSPADGLTGVSYAPAFFWEPIKGSVSYDIWLCNSPTFDDASLKPYKMDNTNPADENNEKFQIPAFVLDSAQVYYWKVRAVAPADTSDWSTTWSFRVTANGIETVLPAKLSMSVFPNPAKNKVSVVIRSSEHSEYELSISNLLGNILISNQVQFANGKSVADIDVSSLPNGVYFVKIQKESSVFMSKLIIDR
jgi:hypothetical protein